MKKLPNLRSFVTHTLRRGSFRWPARGEALKLARIERGLYKCNLCSGSFKNKDIKLDHIIPIVPVKGFDNWDGFINRLFCNSEGFQVLCKQCHESKTMIENNMRKHYKKIDKDKKKG